MSRIQHVNLPVHHRDRHCNADIYLVGRSGGSIYIHSHLICPISNYIKVLFERFRDNSRNIIPMISASSFSHHAAQVLWRWVYHQEYDLEEDLGRIDVTYE